MVGLSPLTQTYNPSPRPSPGGRGRAVRVTCQCIFFVEWEIHVQVTPLNRPLPPGEGWGEGLPATSDSFDFFTPSEGYAARRYERVARNPRIRSRNPWLVPVSFHEDGRWTKIQTGCASSGERNVSASTAVNLLLRASLRINAHTAPREARYQLQLRLGDDVVMTETRRLGEVPRSDRFAAVVRDVPAGSYVYSLWLRLLDGPESNRATADLQWITAQGVPNRFAALREESAGEERIGGQWVSGGRTVRFNNDQRIDLALQSSFTVEDADDDATLDIAYTVDREPLVPSGHVAGPVTRPDSLVAFDARPFLRPGMHPLRLWMRGAQPNLRAASLRVEMVAFPSTVR